MTNKKAFTLVEMLVSMIVAAILMLVVGKLSDIAMASSRLLRKKAETFSDIMYAYKSMQKHVREAGSCNGVAPSSSSTGTASWDSTGSEVLECPPNQPGGPGVAFGVWNASSPSRQQLVFLPDKNSTTTMNVLFEIPATGTNDLELTATPSLNLRLLTITIEGEKDKIPFELETSIKSR